YPLLSAVARQPDDRLKEALDRLVRSELVFGRGEVPEAVYTFKHALVPPTAPCSEDGGGHSTRASPRRPNARSPKWWRATRRYLRNIAPRLASTRRQSTTGSRRVSRRWRARR